MPDVALIGAGVQAVMVENFSCYFTVLERQTVKMQIKITIFSCNKPLQDLFPTAPAESWGCKTWPREEWGHGGWKRLWFGHSETLWGSGQISKVLIPLDKPVCFPAWLYQRVHIPNSCHAPMGEHLLWERICFLPLRIALTASSSLTCLPLSKGKSIRKKQHYLQRHFIQVHVERIWPNIRLKGALLQTVLRLWAWGLPKF